MIQREPLENTSSLEHVPSLTPEGIHELGHVAASDVEAEPDHPTIDIVVNGIDEPRYEPAEASPYLGPAKAGHDFQTVHRLPTEVDDYLKDIFPDSQFTFLGEGRYGIVFADETGKAFKLYKNALSYSMYEREAGAMQMLSEAGLAPKLHLFVDADKEYRLDKNYLDYTEKGFESVQIPRQNSGKELPVLVMDKVDAAPLETADPVKLADGFCKTAELFIRENIQTIDSEVMVDKQTGEIVFLDMGDLFQTPFNDDGTAGAKERHEASILRDIALIFGLTRVEGRIRSAYQQHGLEGIREFIVDFLHTSK